MNQRILNGLPSKNLGNLLYKACEIGGATIVIREDQFVPVAGIRIDCSAQKFININYFFCLIEPLPSDNLGRDPSILKLPRYPIKVEIATA